MATITIYTPVLRDDCDLDGCTVLAWNKTQAKTMLLEMYDSTDLIDVEKLGKQELDDETKQELFECYPEHFPKFSTVFS
jgi:hypothetical protein